MKINRIYIAAFGGLKNKTIDFKDGFSVIYGENENGKTTIMTFIKMMFYGSERGSSSIAKNPRKKYAPWSGEKSAGSIDFEHGGRSYRLEREFGNTNSSDKITLTDMSDGTRESLSGNVGERFFGLSAAAFERSVFVGQFGKAESDSAAESEINSKLSNMVTTGDESVSFAAVSDRLQKARFALLSKSGRAGECDKSKKRLAELESELERAEDIYEKHAEYRKNADIINASIERDAERAAYLKAKIDSEQDIRNAEKLKELLETKEKLERAKEELRLTNGGVIDDLYVGKVKMCLAKLDTAAEKLKDKTDEVQRLSVGIADAEDKGGREKIESLEKEIADLDKKKTETENNISANKKAAEALRATESDVKRKKSGINVVFITVAGFAMLAALLLFAFKMQSVALIPAAVSAVSALLSFILRPADKRALEDYESRLKAFEAEAERLNADKTDVLQQLSLLSARLEAVNTSLGMGTAALENQKKLLLESRKAMEEAENTYKAAEKTLLELYGSYKPAQSTDEIRHELDTLAEKADGLKQIKQKLTYLAKVSETDTVLVKEIRKGIDRTDMEKLAASIVDTLSGEHYIKAVVGIGTPISNVKDLATSFKEAQIAMEVSKVFDTEKQIIRYDNLGIARLIYQLPTTVCEMFLREVFKQGSIESLDQETLFTIQRFFENNLNVSETSRGLFVHRNTLVYRLEKIKKLTGLDLREFDDAIVFKVALMVKKYLSNNPAKY